ncbi:G8 domain-containing protein [Aquimarina sp. SS2-1]|uniref:G8 domain-containing protein n=1 Tax=Aquimarina besae TaxID=3342247 RepID=UPI00366C507B
MKTSLFSLRRVTLAYALLFIVFCLPIQTYSTNNPSTTGNTTKLHREDIGFWSRITIYVKDIIDFETAKSNDKISIISSNFDCAPPPMAINQVRATTSGNWNNPATWGGQLPGNGDMVIIPAGINVNVVTRESARLQYIEVSGTLNMNRRRNTRLLVETLKVQTGGALRIGTSAAPIKFNRTAEIVFLDNGPLTNPTLSNRGLIVEGTCQIFGQAKMPFVDAGDARAGDSSIQVYNAAGTQWQVGDEIVIPATTFNPGRLRLNLAGNELRESQKPTRAQIAEAFADEKVSITAIEGNTITFEPSLRFDHVRPKASLPFHVANVSRNVIFRSESGDSSRRGHTMFMKGSNVTIRGARFYQLGRTDKRIPLDDFEVAGRNTSGASRGQARRKSNPSSVKNNRGRYAIHFHKNGVNEDDVNTALATVTHSVVEDTPGWGFVNHSSHVDFNNNVAFNFTGAGFVTEIGDELGTFDNNIAIQGHGNGELRERRLGFKMNSRLPVINDFGFGGDGFWFQGPAVRATNNIAVSCNGSGMIWFTTGGVQDALIQNQWTYSTFVGMRESIARKVYPGFGSSIRPREIVRGYENEPERMYVLVDFPMLECDNNISYASHIGLNIRFNNAVANKFYEQGPYLRYFNSNNVSRTRQFVSNQIIWNNFMAISASYTSNTQFNNMEVYNAQRRRYGDDYNVMDFGLQGEHSNGLVFNNLELEGYGLAGIFQRRASKIKDPSDVQNVARELVRLHLQRRTCDLVQVTSENWRNDNTLRINFSSDDKQEQVAVRYKAANSLHWIYKSVKTTNSYAQISGLDGEQSYQYQVLRGCDNAVSPKWSDTRTVTSYRNRRTDVEKVTAMSIFPNPATTTIYLDVDEADTNQIRRVLFYNLNGQKVVQMINQTDINKSEIDVSGFSEGLYLIEVLMDNGDKVTKKMMIKR